MAAGITDIATAKKSALVDMVSKMGVVTLFCNITAAIGFAVFAFPENQRKKLRSTNMVERLNREIKRRTRVATLFPNEASLLRLVSAILSETSEEWETGRRYLPREDS